MHTTKPDGWKIEINFHYYQDGEIVYVIFMKDFIKYKKSDDLDSLYKNIEKQTSKEAADDFRRYTE